MDQSSPRTKQLKGSGPGCHYAFSLDYHRSDRVTLADIACLFSNRSYPIENHRASVTV